MTEPIGRLRTEDLLAHAGWIRSLAGRLAADHAAADDLVQETWLRALKNPPGDGRNPPGWLARVTRSARHRQWQSDSRREYREKIAAQGAPDSSPSTDDLVSEAERQQHVGRCVLELDEPYRSSILRHYWRGESAAEIGAATGVSAATVRSQLARARARLQEVLDQGHGGDRAASLRSLLIAAGPSFRFGVQADVAKAVPPSFPSISSWLQGAVLMKTPTTVLAIVALLLILGGGWAAFGTNARSGHQGAGIDESEVRMADRTLDEQATEEGTGTSAGTRESIDLPADTPAPTPAEPMGSERLTTILARAVDHDGEAVRAAVLRKTASESGARSDAEGSLALRLPDDEIHKWEDEVRSMIFVLEAKGHATQFLRATPVLGDTVDLGERVLASEARISGRLRDDLGRGVEGLRVLIAPIGPDSPDLRRRSRGPKIDDGAIETTSGSDGQFLLTGAAAGTQRIWACTEYDGWVFSEPIVVSPGDEIEDVDVLVAAPSAQDVIELRLLGNGDAPLESANLAFMAEGRGFVQHKTVRPNAEGLVRFIAEARVPHDFRIEGPDWELQPVILRGLVPGEPCVTARLTATRSIQVHVRDSKSKEPIEDAWLYTKGDGELSYDPRARKLEHQPVATSPYTIRVPAWAFTVYAKHDSYTPSELGPLEPAIALAENEIVIELDRMASLQGTVTHSGRAVPEAKVELRRAPGHELLIQSYGFDLRMDGFAEASTTTDANGRFTLATGRKADYFLLVTKSGLAAAEIGPITMGPAITNEPVEIEMVKGGSIRGRLLVPDGETSHGRLVALSRLDGSPRVVRTDENGVFVSEDLTPGGWLVEPRDQEVRRSVSVSVLDEPLPPPVWDCEVVDGQTTTFDLDLRTRSMTKISGRLTGTGQDFGAWRARIQSLRHATGDAEIPAILVGDDGRFEFDVEPGGWSLELAGPVALEDDNGLRCHANWKIWSRLAVDGDALPLDFEIEPARLELTTRMRSGPMRVNQRGECSIVGVDFSSTVVSFQVEKDATVQVPVPLGSSDLERPSTGDLAPGAPWESVREVDMQPNGLSVVVDR